MFSEFDCTVKVIESSVIYGLSVQTTFVLIFHFSDNKLIEFGITIHTMFDANVRILTIIVVKNATLESAIPESIVIGKVGILCEKSSLGDLGVSHTIGTLWASPLSFNNDPFAFNITKLQQIVINRYTFNGSILESFVILFLRKNEEISFNHCG
jgi:hypothetical protein